MFTDDEAMLFVAKMESLRSEDPSTKVGCVIGLPSGDDIKIIGFGFNDFPNGLQRREERFLDREEKYRFVIHAEIMAVIDALSNDGVYDLRRCTAYVTHAPCCSCMAVLAEVGIKEVVVGRQLEGWTDRFPESYRVSQEIRDDCGITYREVEIKEVMCE